MAISDLFAASPADAIQEGLSAAVFEPPEDGRAFLLIDASCRPDIHVTLDAFPERAQCLFDGEVGDDLAEVGPWLAELLPNGDVFEWFVSEGWGRDWGVIIRTEQEFGRLKTHLKKFLMVEREDGEKNFFKFYRPRHLNTFLPLFDQPQRQRFMRGLTAWLAEDPVDHDFILTHRLDDTGKLATERSGLKSPGQQLAINATGLET